MFFPRSIWFGVKLCVFLAGFLSYSSVYAVSAFPGAEGFGAASSGGRGGKVIYVTNLNDAGAGSLRAAVEQTGARTIIFRVGGTITLRDTLVIAQGKITIAGQTAPGDGITLRLAASSTNEAVRVVAPDVVIRHLRIRVGAANVGECCRDAIAFLSGADRVIVDHVSTSWATDETISAWYTAKNITVQNSILSEALRYASHSEEGQFQKHSMGVLWGSEVKNISFHHNLLAHNDLRNPRITPNVSSVFEVVNNVIYNRGAFGSEFIGGGKPGRDNVNINYIGNFTKAGASTNSNRYEVGVGSGSATKVYVNDNVGQGRSSNEVNDWNIVGSGTNFTQPAPESFRSSDPFRASTYPITIDPANTIMDKVLANAGATLPRRDAIDRRIVGDVRNGTGDFINDPSEIGGWLSISGGTPYSDNDGDGMSNSWEDNNGLNKNDAADGTKDKDGDGYTNLEEFLHCHGSYDGCSAGDSSGTTPTAPWLGKYWRLENASSQGWLRTQGCSDKNQVPIVQVSKSYTGNCTMYRFEQIDQDYVRIINRASGSHMMPLGCSDEGSERVGIVQMSPENSPGFCSQWKLNRNSEAEYRLQNRRTGQYMRIAGCSKKDDETASLRQVDTSYAGACTLWKFVATGVDVER